MHSKKRHALHCSLLLTLCSTLFLGCSLDGDRAAIRPEKYQETIRIACVGDSITFGAGVKDRPWNNYPRQLGLMLGSKWNVRNFGVSGATLLKRGDKPYWDEKAFQEALAFNPHAVIIKLGTNDTKPQNWQHKDEFLADYQDMIAQFRALPAHPKIWVCLPVPAYPERWGISDERISQGVIPLTRQVAEDTGVSVIDLYQPLSDRPDLFPDQIHPNAEGAKLIAKEIYRALTGKDSPPCLPKVLIIGDSISMGYFEPTRDLLIDNAEIHHNRGNAQHTAYGLEKLDEWLNETEWDVIHFNHGLHDLKYIDEKGRRVDPAMGRQQIPIDQYERNLEALTVRLKRTGSELIFATTTPVPEGASGRIAGDSKRYNQVARKIMAKHSVTVNDLYAFAQPQLAAIQNPRDVHFSKKGSRLLAEQVAKYITQALEE